MRALPFATLLLGVSATFFVVRATVAVGDVPPLFACAAFIGIVGLGILFTDICGRINRRLNRPPKPPYFVIDKRYGGCLELAADGSYESCMAFLSTLESQFNAECSKHLEVGPRPHADKDKGYWTVKIFGQDFFVMRDRGYGLCISGPKAPADLSGFLCIAAYFGAVEYVTWQRKLMRSLQGKPPVIAATTAR